MGVVLLVRHGQASLGSANYDQLSNTGRAQSSLVGKRLLIEHSEVSRVLSGSLVRQRDTALAIADSVGITTGVDDRWNEYDHNDILGLERSAFVFYGDSDTGRLRATTALDQAITRWIRSDSSYIETHEAFLQRCASALDSVIEQRGVTVVATSAGVIAATCGQVLQLPKETWPRLARVMVNTGITKIVHGRSGTSLVTFNDHAHLEPDRSMITYR